MAKLAGFAAIVGVLLAVAAALELMDLLHISGPDLPEWSYRPVGLFLAGFILSLCVMAFRAAERFVKNGWAYRSASGAGSSPTYRDVKCQNPDCSAVNRVRSYPIRKIPRCSKCGHRLPEPAIMHIVRFAYLSPLSLVAIGAAIILLGFFFLDRYLPSLGFVWNAINGTIGGFPYRYVLALGVVIMLLGVLIAAQNRYRNE